MRKSIVCLMLLFVLLPLSAFAVPNLISYQGVLNNSGGVPVSATVNMTFKIYDADTGGNLLWNETQTVQVSNGVFNVQLGSVQVLNPSVFEGDTRYLGIQVGADAEMVPRQRLTSGTYANKAAVVEQTIIPIGSVVAWTKSMPGVPALPSGWVECDGAVLNDPESPLDGQIIPDLNGVSNSNKYLRGSTTSGTLGGTETHTHKSPVMYDESGILVVDINSRDSTAKSGGDYAYDSTWGGRTADSGTLLTKSASTLPSYYSVVWIMKVK